MASKIRQIQRMNSWVMLAGPPSLLMTRRPSSCIPKVCPLCECGLTTQYQRPIRTNRPKMTMPPMMCRAVLPLRSNGIDTSDGMSATRKASIRYWTTRRPVTLVSASLTGLPEPGCPAYCCSPW